MTCRLCGATGFANIGQLAAHRNREHGIRTGFAAPRADPVAKVKVSGRTRRRIEDAAAAAAGSGAPPNGALNNPGETSQEDKETDVEPGLRPDPRGAPEPAAPSGPRLSLPAIRIGADKRAEVSRETVREDLPLPMLADLIRSASRVISEWDGAGEAGVLSPIQATQVAALLYDPTIDFVVKRFGGDTNRFKIFTAVLLIALTKGPVHIRAIRAKAANRNSERQAAERARLAAPDAEPLPQAIRPVPDGVIPPNGNTPGEYADTFADAMRRQEEMQQRGLT